MNSNQTWQRDMGGRRTAQYARGGGRLFPAMLGLLLGLLLPALSALGQAPAHHALTCKDCHLHRGADAEIVGPPVRPCLDCHDAASAAGAGTLHPPAMDLLHARTPGSPTCLSCHGYHDVERAVSPSAPVHPRNVPRLCGSCHLNDALRGAVPQVAEYLRSRHGRMAFDTEPGAAAAVCTDCHGIHPEKNGGRDHLVLQRPEIPETCGRCHPAEYRTYITSVHGTALLRGQQDSAVCTDCHREHGILSPTDRNSSVYAGNIVGTCSRCHGSSQYVRLHNLPPLRVTSYHQTYHGIANKYGDVKIANCVSCHGDHDILPASDPDSTVNPRNTAATCARCHPKAERWQSLGQIHVATTGIQAQALVLVGFLYRLFVFGMILAFVGYIALDLLSYALKRRHHGALPAVSPLRREWLLRLDGYERLQHFILLVSFAVLVLSGFALLMPDTAASHWIVQASGGMSGRGILHRVGAVVLLLLGVVHCAWIVRTARGRDTFRAMLPCRDDFTQCRQTVKYLCGFSREPARFGRFTFIEKFEYWAVIWGMVIMGATGVALTFTDWFLRYWPKWVWDICKLVHGWEAILALVAIVVWHHYHVMWRPGPPNRSWLTGYLTPEQFAEEHALEYARALAADGERPARDFQDKGHEYHGS